MNYLLLFITFALLASVILILESKYDLLRDSSVLTTGKSYSYARSQLVWWTFIILTSFIAIVLITGQVPQFNQSTIVLLGIGAATTASARVIDISDESNAKSVQAATGTAPTLSKDNKSENFFIDILSDAKGVSIHRFQTVAFNFVFGAWFFYRVLINIKGVSTHSTSQTINSIMPDIGSNNLILLGLSAGTYATFKAMENK